MNENKIQKELDKINESANIVNSEIDNELDNGRLPCYLIVAGIVTAVDCKTLEPIKK